VPTEEPEVSLVSVVSALVLLIMCVLGLAALITRRRRVRRDPRFQEMEHDRFVYVVLVAFFCFLFCIKWRTTGSCK
jgi:nitrate reductase gamma subunit